MIKNVFIFGGIWAATATSVALVRHSNHGGNTEESSVEALNPKDFVAGEKEGPFASKYPSYFAATTERNKKFWENRFDDRRDGKDKIELKNNHFLSGIEITSAWDKPEEGKYSLVDFCKEGYSTKVGFDENLRWGFYYSQNFFKRAGTLDFWSLCSVFDSKPETLLEHYSPNDGEDNPYSKEAIGLKLYQRLVYAEDSHDFWDIREQEWQAVEVKDSKYFGDNKKGVTSIKDLCSSAYYKPESREDTNETPNLETVVKYCGLEWTWE